jgi:Phosphoribosyl transferase domain
MIFADRREAGRFLAAKLAEYADRRDVIVLALPRGGVPVAYEVARALHAPLDIFLVRKLGLPGHEELAMGTEPFRRPDPRPRVVRDGRAPGRHQEPAPVRHPEAAPPGPSPGRTSIGNACNR